MRKWKRKYLLFSKITFFFLKAKGGHSIFIKLTGGMENAY